MSKEIERLGSSKLDGFRVVVLPDFFIDRIVRLPSLNVFLKEVRAKLSSGGGSLHHFGQVEKQGGNAVNTAYALGRLGVHVNLIAVADKYSECILESAFSTISNVEIDTITGKPGYTVALEFPYRGRIVNVMLSDVGDISDSGPDKISRSCWKRISEADLVGVFNWAANSKGSKIAKEVFSKALQKNVITYFAPADLSGRQEEISDMFMTLRGIVKVLSINENEARVIAKALSIDPLPHDYGPKEIIKSTRTLSDEIETKVDMHTPSGSASSYKGVTDFANVFKAEQKTCTGAGDVWDAANIMGYLLDLMADTRLHLANTAARLYISSKKANPPSKIEIISNLRKGRFTKG